VPGAETPAGATLPSTGTAGSRCGGAPARPIRSGLRPGLPRQGLGPCCLGHTPVQTPAGPRPARGNSGPPHRLPVAGGTLASLPPGGTEPPTPEEILSLAPEAADDLLERLEREVPVSPRLAKLPTRPFSEAIVFGDTHGDWRSTQRVVAAFLAAPGDRMLIGLGDYVDRAPEDCGYGSVANSLYLLGLASRYPDRVLLIKGNHELHRLVGVLPHDLPEEVDLLWGPEEERYHRIAALLERGPFAAVSPSGVYFAHGGFPKPTGGPRWESEFEGSEEDLALDVGWGECGASRSRRGVVPSFTEADLAAFLKLTGTRLFLRGHDPDLTGRWVFGARCLTLHTSRSYERFGGVLFARVPLDRAVESSKAIAVEHLRDPPV